MQRGYAKLYRKSIDNPLFKKPLVWHYFHYCLLKANHEDKKIIWNKKEMIIERGSFITGRKQASIDTGLSERNIRTAIKTLTNLNMLSKNNGKSTSKFTYLSVCNYSKYHSIENISDQQVTSKRPASDQQVTTTKNKQELINTNNKPPLAINGYSEAYERWWETFPKRDGRVRGKKKTYPLFKKINKADYLNLKSATINYSSEEFIRDPERFLKDDYWKDFVSTAGQIKKSSTPSYI